MNKKELKRKAWNYIADYDETSRIIPDGNIDDAAELIADFIEHLNILKPNELKGVSNNEQKEKVNAEKCNCATSQYCDKCRDEKLGN
jgi:hypothetical protein